MTERSLKLYSLLLSFSDSKFYQVKRNTSVCWLQLKASISADAKFLIMLKIEGSSFGIATRVDEGKPNVVDDVLMFVRNSSSRVLSNNKLTWLPIDPSPSTIELFSNEWAITDEAFTSVYEEVIQVLLTAKELEKQGLYFEGPWTPSVCKKRWVTDSSSYSLRSPVCKPVSRKEYQRIIFDLYTKLASEIVAKKVSELNASFSFNHEKIIDLRSRFFESYCNREEVTSNNELVAHIRDQVRKDVFGD